VRGEKWEVWNEMKEVRGERCEARSEKLKWISKHLPPNSSENKNKIEGRTKSPEDSGDSPKTTWLSPPSALATKSFFQAFITKISFTLTTYTPFTPFCSNSLNLPIYSGTWISEQDGENAAGTTTMTFLPGRVEKLRVSVGEFTFTLTSGTGEPTEIWVAEARETTAEWAALVAEVTAEEIIEAATI
jgi:hypothetical protein